MKTLAVIALALLIFAVFFVSFLVAPLIVLGVFVLAFMARDALRNERAANQEAALVDEPVAPTH